MRLLVTSRAPLGIDGETTWPVPALNLPITAGAVMVAAITESEAGELFVDRARRARADFELTEDNAELVASVCRQLDGIPLALELAAARLRSISLKDLHMRLQDLYGLLADTRVAAPPRHQTLRLPGPVRCPKSS